MKNYLYDLLFGNNSKVSKRFDIMLLVIIVFSVIVVMMESVKSISSAYPLTFSTLEWVLTVLFSLEYLLRIMVHPKPWRYMTSFYGVIDLLAILPSFIGVFLAGSHYLMVIRTLRLLRVFRILKLGRYLREAQMLKRALQGSLYKITVFFGAVLAIALIMGTVMYMVEGEEHGFTSIPVSVYWAIVTITTVGYGDIAPMTFLGKFLSSFLMIVGYSIIAVPTGIFAVEMNRASQKGESLALKECADCGQVQSTNKDNFCSNCGRAHD